MSWTLEQHPWWPDAPKARNRVIVDNDFAGDPDDLFQLAHHLLSPSSEVVGVVCSHLRQGDPWAPEDSAGAARAVVEDFAELMQVDLTGRLYTGAKGPLAGRKQPQDSDAARFIVAEAMKDDPRPLYVACGGGLTDIASAWLLEPRIADRLTLVWIGGPEHDGLAYPPPDIDEVEYNLNIDITAGQVVFNDSDLRLWQVPRDAYRQCLVSFAELQRRVRPLGAFGERLYGALQGMVQACEQHGLLLGECYVIGDQPLVTLTCLQTSFQPDAASNGHVLVDCPVLDERGQYTDEVGGRQIRVYTRIDTRLTFEDMFAKFEHFSAWLGG